jgi:hypothetical protein
MIYMYLCIYDKQGLVQHKYLFLYIYLKLKYYLLNVNDLFYVRNTIHVLK